MMQRKYWLFTLPLLFCHLAQAVELMQWQRIPLPVTLHTGHERIIFVDRNVRVGYPAALEGKLRIQSTGGTVYLRAEADFPDTRLQLADMDNGELILLDVHASAGDTLEPIELHDDSHTRREATASVGEDDDASADLPPQDEAPLPVLLTRYAAQMLYAPLRTVEPVTDITPVPAHLPTTLTTLLPDEPVTATPLAAWRRGELTVTAVKLQNRSRSHIDLDPRHLQGDFVTATFQHPWLGEQGTPEDTTVVYLVIRGQTTQAFIPEPAATRPPPKRGQ